MFMRSALAKAGPDGRQEARRGTSAEAAAGNSGSCREIAPGERRANGTDSKIERRPGYAADLNMR
jgi:hypothetical protein